MSKPKSKKVKEPKKPKVREYAELHDKAVKKFKRASNIPFWAAALNVVGVIMATLIRYTSTGNTNFPTRFLLAGPTNWITLWSFQLSGSKPELIWLSILLAIIGGAAISAVFILLGHFQKNPPKKKMIIANLVVQIIFSLIAIAFYLYFAIGNHFIQEAIQEMVGGSVIQAILLYFSIDTLVQYNKVFALEKEFAGKNITLSETKVVHEKDFEKKGEAKNYDFLEK